MQAGEEARLQSFSDERNHLEAAVSAANDAEVTSGLAILAGEVTVEQSDQYHELIEAAGITRPNYVQMLAELSVEIDKQEVKTQSINNTMAGLFFVLDECSGPVLSFWQNQAAAMKERKINRLYKGELRTELVESELNPRLLRSGKCSSPEIKKAAKEINSVK